MAAKTQKALELEEKSEKEKQAAYEAAVSQLIANKQAAKEITAMLPSSDVLRNGQVIRVPGSAATGQTPRQTEQSGTNPAPVTPTIPQGVTPTTPQGVTPAAQIPQAVMPSGTIPQAVMPNGTVPLVQMPTGAIPQAVMPSGAIPQAVMPNGAVPQAVSAQAAEQVRTADPFAYAEWKGGTYRDAMDEAMKQILSRGEFKYDVNGDALYQQLREQAVNAGRLAMMDTMGQAAALTGGYGNSYAQSVGQQAYQGALQGLNEQIPELYRLAMERYQMQGQEAKDRYNMAADQYAREYGEYQDAYGRAMDAYNINLNNQRYAEETNYARNRDALADQRYAEETNYARSRDRLADERYAEETNYARSRDALADQRYAEETDYARTRDRLADERYAEETNYARNRDALNDQRYADEVNYERGRDALEDSRYADETNYSRAMDAIDAEYRDKTYDANYGYEAERSAERDAIKARLASMSDSAAMAEYVQGLVDRGVIGAEEGARMLAVYQIPGAGTTAEAPKTTGSEKESASMSAYRKQMEGLTSQTEAREYVNRLVQNGLITPDDGVNLYSTYSPTAAKLSETEWTLEDNGGVNWFWGLDNNAKVRDPAGNVYTLKELKNKLMNEEGMAEEEADEYVMRLQKKLGA